MPLRPSAPKVDELLPADLQPHIVAQLERQLGEASERIEQARHALAEVERELGLARKAAFAEANLERRVELLQAMSAVYRRMLACRNELHYAQMHRRELELTLQFARQGLRPALEKVLERWPRSRFAGPAMLANTMVEGHGPDDVRDGLVATARYVGPHKPARPVADPVEIMRRRIARGNRFLRQREGE